VKGTKVRDIHEEDGIWWAGHCPQRLGRIGSKKNMFLRFFSSSIRYSSLIYVG